MNNHAESRIDRTPAVRYFNDQFRRSLLPSLGKVLITHGVQTLSGADQCALLALVQNFKDFKDDNDPYKEHDFGRVLYKGTNYFFKIDYYDKSIAGLSLNPGDPSQCTRVLVVMLADEY